ncbi:MAG: EFR1 family ferrodoxin [Oscillospiraceae bacterium]
MKIHCMYFSPTGATKKAAMLVSDALSGDVIGLDISCADTDYSQYSFAKDDVCVIAVPSYGGRVPSTALARIKAMSAGGAKAVLLTSFGNRDYDDTLLELKNEATKIGFNVVAAIAAVTEHSIMRQFGTGRPDAADAKELVSYAHKIAPLLQGDAAPRDITVKGNMPYREYNGVPLKPKADKACTNCGVCAKLCPVGAISAENGKVTNNDICISCMRCIAVCPHNARSLNKLMLLAVGKKMSKACSERKENKLFL